MVGRLRANPLIRGALLAAALAFCGLGLASQWPHAQAAFTRLHWYSLAGSFLVAVAGAGCMMMAWRAVLADLGDRLPVGGAIHISSIAQVGKYLPGAVWAYAAQVELGRDYQIPRRRSTAAVAISLFVALGTGLLIGTVALPIASAGTLRHYWWIMVAAPLVAFCLLPPVLRWLLDRAFAIARQQPLERPMSSGGLLRAVGLSLLGWMFWGLHAWLLISGLVGGGSRVLLLSLGAYALAWSAGILLVVFPGGIGPRELAFVAALAPVMPRGSALVVALMSRVVMTAGDIAWASVGLTVGRLTRNSRTAISTVRLARHVAKHRRRARPIRQASPLAAGPVRQPAPATAVQHSAEPTSQPVGEPAV